MVSKSAKQSFYLVPKEVTDSAAKIRMNSVKVFLQANDASGTVKHHRWIWNLSNTSRDVMEYLYYFVEGDTPKSFPDLNVKVTDKDGISQSIFYLSKERPTRKEFYISLRHHILPSQKNRTFVLEYDWEEPDRKFVYSFQSYCTRCTLELRLPKKFAIKPSIYWVDFKRDIKRALSIRPLRKHTKKYQS